MDPLRNIYDRVKSFENPFVYVILNGQVERFCSYCLRKPNSAINNDQPQAEPTPTPKLQLCANCRFSRYCDKTCQKQAWRDHKPECARLKRVFPNLPVSEAIFLARVVDKVRFLEAKPNDPYEWQKERRFEDLMTHEKEIREDEEKMRHFEKIYEKCSRYMGEEMPEKERFFLIFCRTWINSHSIHTNVGDEIGMALDLGVSRYDHSCRPNMTLVFDGFRAIMRPLAPDVDARNYKRSQIAYVDVGRSKYQRRRELRAKWYFWCECERCMDPDDDKLTAIKCTNPRGCPEPIVITEDTEPINIVCPRCSTVVGEDEVVRGRDLMLKIPSKFEKTDKPEEIAEYKRMLDEARGVLHADNIYYCRLMTAYLQMTGGTDQTLTNPEVQKMIYQNYRRCLPQSDRHIGYQLLHLVKTLIEKGKREEAITYAYEAMVIFETCFGLEHPYYLQTLALWTYLDQRTPKTDQELINLMNFNYNRPVDLTSLLAAAATATI